MRLVIFHYHLLPGGVTGVIEQMASALDAASRSVSEVAIVTGSNENLEGVRGPWKITVMPEIGYVSRQRLADYAVVSRQRDTAGTATASGPIGQVSAAEVAAGTGVLAERIAARLREEWSGEDTVWWVHNHHLGKNPAFTRALFQTAEELPWQRIVFHIHDFPECGRYSNLRFLHQAGAGALYPQGPNLSYVTINSRDRDILRQAGISEVEYLPNPVATAAPPRPARSPEEVRDTLDRAFGGVNGTFDPTAPLLLYPVRTIRRKNVFEAALLTALIDDRAGLVVTLPGVSQAEKQYSQMVQHAFAEGTVPGLWGIGTGLDEAGIAFSDLQASADAIISSSVQEGFGFQYITPILAGTPLIARYLDIMADIAPLYDDWPHAFYTRLLVPPGSPSLSGPQALLRFRYTERIDRLAAHLPDEVVDGLHRDVRQLVEAEAVDFSFLLPHMQYTYLKDLRHDPGFRRVVRELNGDVVQQGIDALAAGAGITGERSEAQVARVEAQFGLQSFAQKVDGILSRPPGTANPDAEEPDPAVLRAFASLEYQRLLYE